MVSKDQPETPRLADSEKDFILWCSGLSWSLSSGFGLEPVFIHEVEPAYIKGEHVAPFGWAAEAQKHVDLDRCFWNFSHEGPPPQFHVTISLYQQILAIRG